MNNSKMKEVILKLDFIPPGTSNIEIWADGDNANDSPKELNIFSRKVTFGESLKVIMANNGGFVARIKGN